MQKRHAVNKSRKYNGKRPICRLTVVLVVKASEPRVYLEANRVYIRSEKPT